MLREPVAVVLWMVCVLDCPVNIPQLLVWLVGMGALRRGPNPEDVQYVREALAAKGGPEVPHNFMPTAPGHDGRQRRGVMPTHAVRNPQVRLGFLWPHEAPAGGGRYKYRAPCPRLIGSCLDLASPTKGRKLGSLYCSLSADAPCL